MAKISLDEQRVYARIIIENIEKGVPDRDEDGNRLLLIPFEQVD